MVLPKTELAVWLVLALSMVCLAAWPGSLKIAKKLRYELFYYDFTWGVLIASVLAAFTLGMLDSRELTFQDNFLLTGNRKIAWALGAGGVVNLGTLLLLAAVSVSGIAVAFPIALGIAWAGLAVWTFFVRNDVNIAVLLGGAAALLAATILSALAYRSHLVALEEQSIKALQADPRSKKAPARPRSARAVVLAVISGLILSVFFPAIGEAMSEDNGLASYLAMPLVAAGMFWSSLLYIPFFMNFPVRGEPLQVRSYFQVAKGQHIWGLIGGFIWTAGLLAMLVADDSAGIPVDPLWSFVLTRAWPVLALIFGIALWREYRGAVQRVWMLVLATSVLFVAGVVLVGLAPVYGR